MLKGIIFVRLSLYFFFESKVCPSPESEGGSLPLGQGGIHDQSSYPPGVVPCVFVLSTCFWVVGFGSKTPRLPGVLASGRGRMEGLGGFG